VEKNVKRRKKDIGLEWLRPESRIIEGRKSEEQGAAVRRQTRQWSKITTKRVSDDKVEIRVVGEKC